MYGSGGTVTIMGMYGSGGTTRITGMYGSGGIDLIIGVVRSVNPLVLAAKAEPEMDAITPNASNETNETTAIFFFISSSPNNFFLLSVIILTALRLKEYTRKMSSNEQEINSQMLPDQSQHPDCVVSITDDSNTRSLARCLFSQPLDREVLLHLIVVNLLSA